MDNYKIKTLEQYIQLWLSVYKDRDYPDWDNLILYYDDNIYFKDTVQEIRGITEFKSMVERLSKRSQKLEILIHHSAKDGHLIFVEWELQIQYKKYPKSSIFGSSRITLFNGKIINQRDYYDLWGDIFDNIFFMKRGYRRFMKKRFG